MSSAMVTLASDNSSPSAPPVDASRERDEAPATADDVERRDAEFAREALPWIDDVYRFALSLTRDEADADDVVQETYLRAYRSWHTFIPGTDCRRWLFT